MPTELPITDPRTPLPGESWNVLWTRGRGSFEIARLVSFDTATRVDHDLKMACIAARANVLVSARMGTFDLAATIVPHGFDPDRSVSAVVGAVGTGPHSPLAAETTRRLALGLEADAVLATLARSSADQGEAIDLLDRFAALVPGATTSCVVGAAASMLVESIPPDALIVLGAPGGSWWQRQFFGPGRRLMHAAPSGTVVVRAANRRCFHDLDSLTGVGVLMRAGDAASVIDYPVVPVIDDGRVVGLLRRAAVSEAGAEQPVAEIMEDPVAIEAHDKIQAARDVADHFEGGPVPVVDDTGRLLGGITV